MGMKFHGDKTRRAAVATRGGQSLGACDGHTHGACNTRLSGAALAVHLPRAAVRRQREMSRGARREVWPTRWPRGRRAVVPHGRTARARGVRHTRRRVVCQASPLATGARAETRAVGRAHGAGRRASQRLVDRSSRRGAAAPAAGASAPGSSRPRALHERLRPLDAAAARRRVAETPRGRPVGARGGRGAT